METVLDKIKSELASEGFDDAKRFGWLAAIYGYTHLGLPPSEPAV
ncbi:MAG: hypothetical protein ACI4SY_02125 [Sutterella sp.]